MFSTQGNKSFNHAKMCQNITTTFVMHSNTYVHIKPFFSIKNRILYTSIVAKFLNGIQGPTKTEICQHITSIATWLKKEMNTIPRIAIISSRINSTMHSKNGNISNQKHQTNAISYVLSENA